MSEQTEISDLKKKVLATGLRVGTNVKTKFMKPFITDPQVDQQAIIEATGAGIPVIGVSNTDNITSEIDLVIPANNRGRKAVATIYWLLTRQILIERGELKDDEEPKFMIEDFETKIADVEEEL